MNYRAITLKIIETIKLIELVKTHNGLKRDLEKLYSKREFYLAKLNRLNK